MLVKSIRVPEASYSKISLILMGLESCYVSFQNGGFKSFENSTIKLSAIETKYIG